MTKSKNSLLEMSSEDETLQNDLLTLDPDSPIGTQLSPEPKKPRGPGRPPAMGMLGVRMTKNKRYEIKALAAEMKMSVQDLVQVALEEYKAKRGLL